ncbi:hypothetical protein JTB14_011930 [Gonioctena quinquepunctata]|nr:hypothetical protein JTB14_011930 [Gonioctena quinquepunctata]
MKSNTPDKKTDVHETKKTESSTCSVEIPNTLKYSNAVAGSSKNSTITRKHLSGAALHEVSTSSKCQEIIELGKNLKKSIDEDEWKTFQRTKHRRQIVVGSKNTIQVNGRHDDGSTKVRGFACLRSGPINARQRPRRIRQITLS